MSLNELLKLTKELELINKKSDIQDYYNKCKIIEQLMEQDGRVHRLFQLASGNADAYESTPDDAHYLSILNSPEEIKRNLDTAIKFADYVYSELSRVRPPNSLKDVHNKLIRWTNNHLEFYKHGIDVLLGTLTEYTNQRLQYLNTEMESDIQSYITTMVYISKHMNKL